MVSKVTGYLKLRARPHQGVLARDRQWSGSIRTLRTGEVGVGVPFCGCLAGGPRGRFCTRVRQTSSILFSVGPLFGVLCGTAGAARRWGAVIHFSRPRTTAGDGRSAGAADGGGIND